MTSSKAYQLTSNEIADPINDRIEDAARLHQFSVAISAPLSFNAPFSGDEYFIQNIELLSTEGIRSLDDFEECLLDIEKIVLSELSEGFIDSLDQG